MPALLVAFENGQIRASLTLAASSPPSPGDIAACVEQLLARTADWECSRSEHPDAPAGPGVGQSDAFELWAERVGAGLREIAAARYRKVVLARSVDLPISTSLDSGDVLSALAARYEGCFVFKYRVAGATWLGASPELLASLNGRTVRTVSLAGSRPRGADEAADNSLRDELLVCVKEREEHEIVRAAVAAGIAPFCSDLRHPRQPCVVRMANIQHLCTPFEGTVRPGANLLDIVAGLHPTPAVAGWPRDEALEAIDRIEDMDRGWYGGPIGWIDASGEGQFAVGLRSALVGAVGARLYAGAGIVRGSDPSQEYVETEAKLRPLRESLTAD